MPGGGDLMFCGHHAKQYDASLRKVGVRIIDASTDAQATDRAH